MLRRLIPAITALVLAPAALAAYPGTYAQQQTVIATPGGALRLTPLPGGPDATRIVAERPNGSVVRRAVIAGNYGIPTLIPANEPLGMFRDGSAFVLQSTANQKASSFAVVRTVDLGIDRTVALKGSWAFDALSPDGSTMYLIHHTSDDFQHYVVRAYDLRAGALVDGVVADKAQRGWVMRGWPVARATTTSGRWVYTLYTDPQGTPFVHALDTVHGVAHCVGFAWTGSQDSLMGYRLEVRGNRLLVLRGSGSVYRAIDRVTWAVRRR